MTIDCAAWRDIGLVGGGRCTLGKFGGKPSHGTCAHCLGIPQPRPAARRLPVLSQEQQQQVAQRKHICQSCDDARRIHQITVSCKRCGCAGLSLVNGKCPRDQWTAELVTQI